MDTTEAVELLKRAFLSLDINFDSLERQMKSDAPLCFVPSLDDPQALIIQSIRQRHAEECIVRSGILCATPKILTIIQQINENKKSLMLVVSKIKGQNKNSARIRTSLLKQSLQALGETSIDLRSCYSQIQLLPKNTQSVSWTWAMKPSSQKKFTVAQAIELANKLTNENAKLAAMIQINQLDANEILLQKYSIPPQLKANIKFINQNDDVIRKPIAVSGILIAQQSHLPVYVWREIPIEKNVQLPRNSLTEKDAFIPTLSMYRYV